MCKATLYFGFGQIRYLESVRKKKCYQQFSEKLIKEISKGKEQEKKLIAELLKSIMGLGSTVGGICMIACTYWAKDCFEKKIFKCDKEKSKPHIFQCKCKDETLLEIEGVREYIGKQVKYELDLTMKRNSTLNPEIRQNFLGNVFCVCLTEKENFISTLNEKKFFIGTGIESSFLKFWQLDLKEAFINKKKGYKKNLEKFHKSNGTEWLGKITSSQVNKKLQDKIKQLCGYKDNNSPGYFVLSGINKDLREFAFCERKEELKKLAEKIECFLQKKYDVNADNVMDMHKNLDRYLSKVCKKENTICVRLITKTKNKFYKKMLDVEQNVSKKTCETLLGDNYEVKLEQIKTEYDKKKKTWIAKPTDTQNKAENYYNKILLFIDCKPRETKGPIVEGHATALYNMQYFFNPNMGIDKYNKKFPDLSTALEKCSLPARRDLAFLIISKK